MEEDYKSAVQHQRRVNPKIHDVIKKEVEKLLDAGLIYPISDSPWVSPVHCVPKKGGFTVVKNEENELIPTRLVTGWRMVSPGIFKFPSTLVIKKKQRLPALMERSPTVACLSVCAMRREHFKDRFLTKPKALWVRVVKAIHGLHGKGDLGDLHTLLIDWHTQKYGTNALSKFSLDTELVLYPLQDKLTSGDKNLDLSAFKLSRLFFSLLSSGSSNC
nr:reverse transcriptase domain-containing protein [Tanacetum cinerariifolium]